MDKWGGLGATHYRFRPDVYRVLQELFRKQPTIRANTYHDHPWPGWDSVSVDLWGEGGRGHAIPENVAWSSIRFLMRMPGLPNIRHIIYQHSLWTSWGGWSYWSPADHSGKLAHVHVTYWR